METGILIAFAFIIAAVVIKTVASNDDNRDIRGHQDEDGDRLN